MHARARDYQSAFLNTLLRLTAISRFLPDLKTPGHSSNYQANYANYLIGFAFSASRVYVIDRFGLTRLRMIEARGDDDN